MFTDSFPTLYIINFAIITQACQKGRPGYDVTYICKVEWKQIITILPDKHMHLTHGISGGGVRSLFLFIIT